MAAPAAAWRSPDLPIRVGISACLLGEAVRYDGGHQKDHYITGVLAQHFSWVSVCPELEVGMGVPREPVRLVGSPEAPRLLGVTSGTDHTGRMNAFARRRVQDLAREKLSFLRSVDLEDRVSIVDLQGNVIGRFGSERSHDPGKFWGPHGIWTDSVGDLYVAEVLEGARLQKFARIK